MRRADRDLEAGDAKAAAQRLTRAMTLDPTNADAALALALLYHRRGNHDAALKPLNEALRRAPGRQDLKIQLAQVLLDGGHLPQADKAFELVLRESPHEPFSRSGRATIAMRRGQPECAMELLQDLVEERRPHVNAASTWGRAALLVGRVDEARDVVERALVGASDPAVAILGHLLGDILASLREHAGAFRAHARANAATRVEYDPKAHTREVEQRLELARSGACASLARAKVDGSRALLIVGMPRSGTSLTEQILARHSAVHAAGEREDLRLLEKALRAQHPGTHMQAMTEMDEAFATRMGRHYLERVGHEAPAGSVLVDKMPQNYLQLALAACVLPGVRVVHCVRDARETALSCFFQSFGSQQAFSTRLDWLGQRIVEQRRLMAELPEALELPLMTLHYERLVQAPERTIRELLEFAQLPFEQACLSPHESERLVNTASWAQVKKPIHAGSLGRTAHYSEPLGPLDAVLGDVR
ncbi:MAG: tetratricopeptide repeat protein [Deltaproteobacteria bacterium]|nr:tetratricopeptide repeat protein [Deltaproteobacteria bacterium]